MIVEHANARLTFLNQPYRGGYIQAGSVQQACDIIFDHTRDIRNDVPIILLSGCLTIPEEDLALFHRFISKGDSPAVLLAAIEELLASAEVPKHLAA